MSRIVVVGGGCAGTGLAVAEAFVRDGDQVVLVGRRGDVLDEAVARLGSGSALAVPADLTDETEAAGVRDLVAGRFGRVDVLVDNAGGNVALGGGEPSLTELWTGDFRSNVLTAVLLTEALRDLLADGGRVLLLSSIAAVRGGSGSYGAAKAALHPYAYDLAADLGGRGITVDVVAPGFIDDTGFFGGRMTRERRAFHVGQTLNGRVGVPEDVASLVHWLASPGAAHVTAQIHQVNGGAERGR
ncbi:SDR family NAD(P)-dependent oxidoreductase [Actinacidiphila glaucinigra]|uniref:SDR family NAD(P)-dependent oxidoreductase n=1 Tax=Actinacidiphila glaucinigra TaxID=235986 RepID=UPI0036CFD11C